MNVYKYDKQLVDDRTTMIRVVNMLSKKKKIQIIE